jgi:uncharacterized protein (DUF4415 family)
MKCEWDEAKNRSNLAKHGFSFEDAELVLSVNKKPIKSDLARIDRMKDSDIDYSDIPELGDDFFTKATVPWPPAKHQLTIRLDADVLEWLKANGRGYQTRINRILRAAMESQPPRRSRSTAASKNSTRAGGRLKPASDRRTAEKS